MHVAPFLPLSLLPLCVSANIARPFSSSDAATAARYALDKLDLSARDLFVEERAEAKRCTDAERKVMVDGVKQKAKDGEVLAQWYPGYNSDMLPVKDIQWSYVNLMYWFVQATSASGLDTTVDGPIEDFVSAAHANGVPVIFTVGGWDGGLYFSSLVAANDSRTEFVKQIHDFVDKYDLDGVDIDWEYPASQGIGCNNISKDDTTNLALFLTELRTELGDDMFITADVTPSGFVGPDGDPLANVTAITDSLDFINIMNYDTYGSWTQRTGPNAPLSDVCNGVNVGAVSAISGAAQWEGAGVESSKLVLGVPAYGYAYTTKSSELMVTNHTYKDADGTKHVVQSKLFQKKLAKQPEGDAQDTEGTDVCGNAVAFSGYFNYPSLLSYGFLAEDEMTGTNGFTRYWDNCTSTPFLFNPSNRTLISYDDAESVGIKASWTKSSGLAGVNFFDSTGLTTKLLTAAKTGVQGPEELGVNVTITI